LGDEEKTEMASTISKLRAPAAIGLILFCVLLFIGLRAAIGLSVMWAIVVGLALAVIAIAVVFRQKLVTESETMIYRLKKPYRIKKNGQIVNKFSSDEVDAFLSNVQTLLNADDDFVLLVPKVMVNGLRKLRELLRKTHADIVIIDTSEPNAVDYFLNGIIGAHIGAGAGAVAAIGYLYATAKFALVVPVFGKVITIGCLTGGLIGTAAMLAMARKGLIIRFAKRVPNTLEFDFRSKRRAA
jgi:hypothetical protein